MRGRRGGPLPERFWSRVQIADGCWEWQGTVAPRGYGEFHVGFNGVRNYVKAHRFSYELNVGPIPDGLEIDHLCLNPQCVRPDHLEAVTHFENMRRSSMCEFNRTHCPSGHEFTIENIYWDNGNTVRRCRTCRKAYANRWYAANKGRTK